MKKGCFLFVVVIALSLICSIKANPDDWKSPDSHIECDWVSESAAYDESLTTMATSDYFLTGEYSDYLVLTLDSSITSNKLQFYAWNVGVFPPINAFWIELKVGLGSADTLVYFGDFPRKVWTEKSFSEATIDRMSVRFYGKYSGGYNYLYEVDFWEIEEAPTEYNFYGTINSQHTITSQRSWSFDRYSFINQISAIDSHKTVSFSLFATISQGFSISSIFDYVQTRNFYGTITQILLATSRRIWVFGSKGFIQQVFGIEGYTNLVTEAFNILPYILLALVIIIPVGAIIARTQKWI